MSELKEVFLPTGKSHVSFSEVKTWLDCSWAHKLIHILSLSEFEDSIYSDFGKIVHDASEHYLRTRELKVAEATENIISMWSERGYPNVENWPDYDSAVPDVDYWTQTSENMLNSIPHFLDENFPNWEFVEAEEKFREPIGDTGYYFKGFIDGIIKTEKKGKPIYWIIDWKTASPGGWHPSKRRDRTVQLQLVLYKHFWSQKHNIPLNQIRCAFILLRRDDPNPKKRKKGGNRCSMLTVSAGPKTIDRALRDVSNMINALNRSYFLKNRTKCNFCEFYNTEHCKLL